MTAQAVIKESDKLIYQIVCKLTTDKWKGITWIIYRLSKVGLWIALAIIGGDYAINFLLNMLTAM